MGLLDIKCPGCGGQKLEIDTTPTDGRLDIRCTHCGDEWSDADPDRPPSPQK